MRVEYYIIKRLAEWGVTPVVRLSRDEPGFGEPATNEFVPEVVREGESVKEALGCYHIEGPYDTAEAAEAAAEEANCYG